MFLGLRNLMEIAPKNLELRAISLSNNTLQRVWKSNPFNLYKQKLNKNVYVTSVFVVLCLKIPKNKNDYPKNFCKFNKIIVNCSLYDNNKRGAFRMQLIYTYYIHIFYIILKRDNSLPILYRELSV